MNDNFKTEIGKRLKKIRKDKGLSQKKFASKAKVTIDHIAKVENGHLLPNFVLMQSLHQVFGISLNWFVAGIGNMNGEGNGDGDGEEIDVAGIGNMNGNGDGIDVAMKNLEFKEKYLEVSEENRMLNEKLQEFSIKEN